ncbi:hypothetical protein M5689_001015 [Euphorbia peplus]|nr:hypothetical protein M5689_001015 [Euphorbia peplus]
MPAQNLRRQFLWHLDGIKDLKMGPCFIKSLSAIEMERLSAYPWHADDTFSYPPLNHKCLTFDCGLNFVECLPGIAYALRTSPELEKVVITLRLPEYSKTQDRQNLFWNPKGAVFDSSKCGGAKDWAFLYQHSISYGDKKSEKKKNLDFPLKKCQLQDCSYTTKLRIISVNACQLFEQIPNRILSNKMLFPPKLNSVIWLN